MYVCVPVATSDYQWEGWGEEEEQMAYTPIGNAYALFLHRLLFFFSRELFISGQPTLCQLPLGRLVALLE